MEATQMKTEQHKLMVIDFSTLAQQSKL